MQSTAPTVAKYLLSLPPDRRPAIEAVRRVILANIDKQIEEQMAYGVIGYVIPHRVFPGGYHCDPKQPVPYIGLASQKNHMALYLMFVYSDGVEDQWIRRAYAAKGKRLDMGKSCLRFKALADIDLAIVGEAIRRVPTQQHLATYVATVGADKWRAPPPPPPRLVPLRPEYAEKPAATPKPLAKVKPKAKAKPRAKSKPRPKPKSKSFSRARAAHR